MLVVCEGEKTEPNYLACLVRALGLRTVEVVPAKGSAPTSVVADAARRKKERVKDAKRSVVLVPYDHVYCLMDVDEHPNLPSALETARANNIHVALSNPCFEYWLLLHFERVAASGITRHEARRELEKRLPGYEKGGDFASHWRSGVGQAMQLAEDVVRSQWDIDPADPTKVLECCPSTGVHLLVRFLHEIATTAQPNK